MKAPKKLVSCHKKASVAEQSITNFNRDGVSTHILKNVVYKARCGIDTKKS